jgi:sialic acid synthase SpsE
VFKRKENIFIISELSPQNEGCIDTLKTMILQSKMGGADAVKLQIYDSVKFLGDDRKKFGEISKDELAELQQYAKNLSIELFASAFDKERLAWLIELDVPYLKIPSKMYKRDPRLIEKALNSGKKTFISNGFDSNSFEYKDYENAVYFYCVPKYPANLEDVCLPNFRNSIYQGYSDHTYGMTAAYSAIVKGAKYIEKHFTLSKGMQSSINKAHVGSMTFDELRHLRSFCDDFVRIDHEKAV